MVVLPPGVACLLKILPVIVPCLVRVFDQTSVRCRCVFRSLLLLVV